MSRTTFAQQPAVKFQRGQLPLNPQTTIPLTASMMKTILEATEISHEAVLCTVFID